MELDAHIETWYEWQRQTYGFAIVRILIPVKCHVSP